jgi:CheY-like chemotaxis protein
VADDNGDLQRAIGLGLTLCGATIGTASDGQEAMDRTLAGQFDVVLMDVHMPRLDGLEASRRLRGAGCLVPIIALSADATAECRSASLAAGCDLYVVKPFDMDALARIIRTLHDRRVGPGV